MLPGLDLVTQIFDGIGFIIENCTVAHTPIAEEHHEKRGYFHKAQCSRVKFVVINRWLLKVIGD